MTNASQTYSWEPLLAYVGQRWSYVRRRDPMQNNGAVRGHWGATFDITDQMPSIRLCDLLGLTKPELMRWQRAPLTERRADRIATELGLHPCVIWPEWFANVA